MSFTRQRARAALPLAVAGAATAATFGLIWLAAPPQSYLYIVFFERSWIQQVSTFCFWMAMLALISQHKAYALERQAQAAAATVLAAAPFGPDKTPLIWAEATQLRQKFLDACKPEYAHSIVFTRIGHALDRLHKTQSTHSMQEYCRTRSELDSIELDTSYSDVRFLIWLMPMLGLIGTVMGIGRAISGFSEVISGATDFNAVRKFLPAVTSHLGTAFDTTFVALGLSAVAVFYMSWLLKRQEQLLSSTDTLCFDGLCGSFQEHSTAAREMVLAVHEAEKQLSERMNGNRASIERVVREAVPALFATEVAAKLAAPLQRIESALREARPEGSSRALENLGPLVSLLEQVHADMLELMRALAARERSGGLGSAGTHAQAAADSRLRD